MKNNIVILVLCSLGIAQGSFLCFYLLTLKKGNRLAHQFLALVILGLILRIGKSILNVYLDLEAWQRNLGIAGILLVGPSLWLYGEVLFKRREELHWTTYLHFLPYLLFTLFCWIIPNRGDTISYFIYNAVFAHLLMYLVMTMWLLIKNSQSTQPKIYQWYRNLVIGVGLIWAFYIGNIAGLIPFYIGGALFFTLLVYMFSFLLLRNHTFSLEKYTGSVVDTTLSKGLMKSIVALFETEEVYLNPKLSLSEVAQSLQTSPRILSQVVNENKRMNFSEFVNFYRIENAKKLLVSSERKDEKMVSIAYDSGFGNVTSFNLAFKSFTGLTPSQFKKQNGLS
ncbi:helix-turn-helix domain-containing protein [Muricauda sp. TY007]|uniref:helix-turn-helix domain-containing protein n=1 Tax=Allomuricauda sp. TY007 TaxID=2683200 RepID=UPI0013C18015|nr:helix-turn-helix domain-containing protein [Muricauda sp. TY007]NDV14470.1 helix-turn-helix domain-containing protein [Muricauda sp. TY007]